MPIIKCTHCGKQYDLNIKLSGKKGKCTHCGNEFIIDFNRGKVNNKKQVKSKFQTIKSIILIISIGLLFFSGTLYVSSLNSYKETDFNIPKDFFETKFGDKDPYSDQNGYIDLVNFISLLDKQDLSDFDVLSKCIFNKGSIPEEKCENTNITIDNYQKFERFIRVNRIKYNQINNKAYLLATPEYSGGYDKNKEYGTNGNYLGGGKGIVFTSLLEYGRGMRYVAYKNFEKGDYTMGINVLLDFQNFIDNLINKIDSNLIDGLVVIKISQINLETIEYFLSNYQLPNNLKDKIKLTLQNKIDDKLIENSIKREHINNKTIFQYVHDSAFHDNNVRSIIEVILFLSIKESELISDKIMFDIITNNGNKGEFSCSENINNYIGRKIICNYKFGFPKQYQKEFELGNLRNNILQNLD